MKNITVISDPGIDDLVALALLHKLNTNAKNCLVSAFGNAPEKITAQNAKEYISFVSPRWQFMHGSSTPFNNKFEHPWPEYFHGPDGVWGIHPAADISGIDSLKVFPNNKGVISLAPLTDVNKILKGNRLSKITVMGGAINIEGNETPFAETNIAFDPDSARLFFSQCLNINVRVVPLDVTRKVFWTKDIVNKIPELNKLNIWIKELLLTWFDKYNHDREKDFNLHDPLAVYLSYFPKQAVWTKSGIEVIIKGKRRGQTILNEDKPVCSIALDLKNAAAVSEKIYDLIFAE